MVKHVPPYLVTHAYDDANVADDEASDECAATEADQDGQQEAVAVVHCACMGGMNVFFHLVGWATASAHQYDPCVKCVSIFRRWESNFCLTVVSLELLYHSGQSDKTWNDTF